jgi:hypothetical protein
MVQGTCTQQQNHMGSIYSSIQKHWPPVIITEKTKAEYERELLEHILASEEVGKKMMLYDRECWTHVTWAVKTLQFTTNAGIE